MKCKDQVECDENYIERKKKRGGALRKIPSFTPGSEQLKSMLIG